MKSIDEFLQAQNNRMENLYKPVLFNHWMAKTTGEKEWGLKHEKALGEYFANFADTEAYNQVKAYRGIPNLTLHQSRQLDDLYNKMVKNQLDKEDSKKTLELESEISAVFNTYRPIFEGKKVANNDLLNILKNSTDENQRKEAWLASKQVGKEIEKNLLKLVHKRNEDARQLGFENYFELSFHTQELDLKTVFDIFQQLKELSDEPFRKIKTEIDRERSEELDISQENLRPWHYVDPFFQEAPSVSGADLDSFYKDKNLEQIAVSTFKSMGLDISDILEKSDLYPRENKNPFGFCTNVDRKGDVRILVNLDESSFWTTALLHEFGHAVYFKYIKRELPFILRFHSHSLTTEAIALFFGRMTKTLTWQKRFLGVEDEKQDTLAPAINKMLQRQMLVAARWIITFSFFEKALYEDPDQDLNQMWWKLVKEIQYINPPEETSYPDWAAKMHFSLAPASYQDYLLGELTASQLEHFISSNISTDLFTPAVGDYLKDNFFSDGAMLHWNDKILKATGERLNPSYFVKEFIG